MLFTTARVGRTIVAAFIIFFISSVAQAGDTGKLRGKITDKESGEGLVASISVKNTDYGAESDLDGNYTILNIPPGIYDVEISELAHHTLTFRDVSINIDLTTELNASLTANVLELEEVEIVFVKPIVEKGTSSSMTRFSKDVMNIIKPTSVESILKATTGIKIDPEGKMHMRGGRAGDAAVIVDGVDYRDPIQETQINVQLSSANTDEVNVLTGGFNAEYGRVMSGVIQIRTSEGDVKKYEGRIDYTTDRIIDNYSYDTDRAEISIGGPVPYAEKILPKPVTFFFSGITRLTNTFTPFSINRDANDYLGLGLNLPERQRNDYQGSLKLGYKLTESKKLTLSLRSAYAKWDIYPDGEGGISGNYGYNYKYNIDNRPWASNSSFSSTLEYTNQISNKTFYNLKFITYFTESKVQPRGKTPGEFTLEDNIEDDPSGFADSDGNGFIDGYLDANQNDVFDGGGEGYEDINFNGRWDRGEDWVDLNGNGIYDAAEPFIDVVNPLTGENNLGVYDPWDSYSDVNKNGRWDPAEPQLPEHDWNGNGFWDGERFNDADRDGEYDAWEPWEDVNGNYYWDEGEPYFDTNGNGQFDYSEGYDDTNGNGLVDMRNLERRINNPDTDEPFIDGDKFWDTGEPFVDEPDPVTGLYNGFWDPGEIWFDLPSSSSPQTGAGLYRIDRNPDGTHRGTLNGRYDGPNGLFDEYELFTMPTRWNSNSEKSRPVSYTFDESTRGADWPVDIFRYIPGFSTWTNRSINDSDAPVFNLRNYSHDEGQEPYEDYNQNGKWDTADQFLNPGLWDANAYWYERTSMEYSVKFDIQSQVTQYHEMKAGVELTMRDLEMQAIQRPDELYSGEASLPASSPWPDRGGIRDFYNYQPWEGATFIQDKMEFEGLIVNAGIRFDFVIHDKDVVDEFRERVANDEPGAVYATRGTWRVSPRLGISHPITERSKLYFNYGHFYQAPSFTYFYKSATANLDVNTAIGNPNLEYEKTIQYELGVNNQISDYVVFDISGYYKDQYDLISTNDERWKNLTLDRYVNLDYGRMRGFELSVEKRPANHWAMTVNYDFSYAFGKSSDQNANQDARLRNVPYNYDEHPLAWDETHKINAYLTVLYDKNDHPIFFGMVLPDDWLMTMQWEFGSGLPYTPSKYTTGIDNENLILPNSARYPWHERTSLKFEKYYTINPVKNNRAFFGFTIENLFDKQNVSSLYPETGSPKQRYHPLNPEYNPSTNRAEYDANPRNYESGRNVLFRVGMTF